MSPAVQAKLLRLLQQREYIPVGDTRTVHCDIRVVAATNRDLEAEVAAGRFREDLYYRINVVHVHLPPLRDRREDIELLAMHFLKMVTARNGRSTPTGIDQRAMRALREYDWRGNIRELENAIERAVVLSRGEMLGIGDLPPALRQHKPAPDILTFRVGTPLKTVEKALIEATLRVTDNDKVRAAALLGITSRTIYRREAEWRGDPREDDEDL